MWIIVLFWLWGGRGFGNGFGGNGNDCCANGLPAQLNNDYGRELLTQAIQGNERELERNERELEKRQKHHEREDEMYRKGWFGEREIRDEYDSMDPYMRRGRRSRYY